MNQATRSSRERPLVPLTCCPAERPRVAGLAWAPACGRGSGASSGPGTWSGPRVAALAVGARRARRAEGRAAGGARARGALPKKCRTPAFCPRSRRAAQEVQQRPHLVATVLARACARSASRPRRKSPPSGCPPPSRSRPRRPRRCERLSRHLAGPAPRSGRAWATTDCSLNPPGAPSAEHAGAAPTSDGSAGRADRRDPRRARLRAAPSASARSRCSRGGTRDGSAKVAGGVRRTARRRRTVAPASREQHRLDPGSAVNA